MKLRLNGGWGLRLLALVLAIIIYHSLKDENSKTEGENDRSIFKYR